MASNRAPVIHELARLTAVVVAMHREKGVAVHTAEALARVLDTGAGRRILGEKPLTGLLAQRVLDTAWAVLTSQVNGQYRVARGAGGAQ